MQADSATHRYLVWGQTAHVPRKNNFSMKDSSGCIQLGLQSGINPSTPQDRARGWGRHQKRNAINFRICFFSFSLCQQRLQCNLIIVRSGFISLGCHHLLHEQHRISLSLWFARHRNPVAAVFVYRVSCFWTHWSSSNFKSKRQPGISLLLLAVAFCHSVKTFHSSFNWSSR